MPVKEDRSSFGITLQHFGADRKIGVFHNIAVAPCTGSCFGQDSSEFYEQGERYQNVSPNIMLVSETQLRLSDLPNLVNS